MCPKNLEGSLQVNIFFLAADHQAIGTISTNIDRVVQFFYFVEFLLNSVSMWSSFYESYNTLTLLLIMKLFDKWRIHIIYIYLHV